MDERKEEYKEGDIIEEGPWADFEIISRYTRSQAISDGVLVDVTAQAKALRITLPVAITDTLFNGYITPDAVAEEAGETAQDRLRATLGMMAVAIRQAKDDSDTLFFNVQFTRHGRPHIVKIKSICGPGDNAEPVITLMLPEED